MTGKEIMQEEFEKSGMRGYRADQVDLFLQKVADYVDGQAKQINDLTYKIQILADKIEEYKAEEGNIRDALLSAQKLGASIVNEAKTKAEAMTTEAKTTYDNLMSQAKSKVDSLTKEQLDKANADLIDLKRQTEKEQRRLELTKREVANFKASIIKQYKNHLDSLNNLPNFEEEKKPVSAPVPQVSVKEEKQEVSENKILATETAEDKNLSKEVTQVLDSAEVKAEAKTDEIPKQDDITMEISKDEFEQTKEFEDTKPLTKLYDQDNDAPFKPQKPRSQSYAERFGELQFGGFSNKDK